MKVCFITGEYPPMQGGIADYTRELAFALHALGADVSILTSSRARSVRSDGERPEPRAAVCSADPWTVYPIVERWSFRSWNRILAHLRDVQPDIVHIQYQTSAYGMHPAINLLPLLLKRERQRPGLVTTLHDLGVPYLFPKAGKLRHKVTLALIRGSDSVIVTNGEDWRGACSLVQSGTLEGSIQDSMTAHKISIVPIGNNIPVSPPDGFARDEWRASFGVHEGCTLLSYFGFLNQSKGVETLLQALRFLVLRGVDTKLVMIGADVGDSDPTNVVYRKRIVTQIDELGLGGNVIWTGYSTARDVSGHLLSSDICVLPFRDGASFRRTTLITALAHGLPIISTKRQASRGEGPAQASQAELMDGRHAVLVPPDGAAELAQAINELIQQPDLRTRLGEEGHKLAEAFSWPAIAEKTLSLYEGLILK